MARSFKDTGTILQEIHFEPLTRTGISDLLVEKILGFVKAGQLLPGDRLPSERELATKFGVSRPTVREAMRALSVLGVLEIHHGGGAFVTALDAADLLKPLTFFLSLSEVSIEKLYEARRFIEGEICALAAAHADDTFCDALDKMILDQVQVIDQPEVFLERDSDFHALIAETSGNVFLARTARSLNVLGIEFRRLSAEQDGAVARSIEDHRRILSGLRARDTHAAREAMERHMIQVYATTKAALDPDLHANRPEQDYQ